MRSDEKLWTAVGKYGRVFEFRPQSLLRLMATQLGLEAGDRVLDIGCGSGPNFDGLLKVVGPDGHVHGFDHNPRMVARARRRVADAGWPNVEVAADDATRTRLAPGSFDAAIATYSISATSDVRATMANAYAALRSGGKLLVLDVRLEPAGRVAPLIRALAAVYRRMAGWTGVETLDAARETFEKVEVITGTGARITTPLPSWPPLVNFVATKA